MSKVIAIALDGEFTSFDMQGGDLIEIGLCEILEGYTLGRRFSCYLKPRSEKYFTEGAREVHGISYFKALTFPEKKASIIKMLHWLKPLMGQFPLKTAYYGSWEFDLRWIETTMKLDEVDLFSSFSKAFKPEKSGNIDVMKLAKKYLQNIPPTDKGEKGRFTLGNVADFYSINHEHHNAGSDAAATAEIFCKIMRKENTWSGELFDDINNT